jgi:hypothetical protein
MGNFIFPTYWQFLLGNIIREAFLGPIGVFSFICTGIAAAICWRSSKQTFYIVLILTPLVSFGIFVNLVLNRKAAPLDEWRKLDYSKIGDAIVEELSFVDGKHIRTNLGTIHIRSLLPDFLRTLSNCGPFHPSERGIHGRIVQVRFLDQSGVFLKHTLQIDGFGKGNPNLIEPGFITDAVVGRGIIFDYQKQIGYYNCPDLIKLILTNIENLK